MIRASPHARLPLLALALLACSPRWEDVVSTDGRFSVRMPGSPREQTRAVKTVYGSEPMRIYAVEWGGRSFMVSFIDYPEHIVGASTPEAILNGARDGAAVTIQGTVVRERATSFEGHPERVLRLASLGGAQVLRMRLILVGNRLYQLVAGVPVGDSDAETVSAFLESFALLGRPEADAE